LNVVFEKNKVFAKMKIKNVFIVKIKVKSHQFLQGDIKKIYKHNNRKKIIFY